MSQKEESKWKTYLISHHETNQMQNKTKYLIQDVQIGVVVKVQNQITIYLQQKNITNYAIFDNLQPIKG